MDLISLISTILLTLSGGTLFYGFAHYGLYRIRAARMRRLPMMQRLS